MLRSFILSAALGLVCLGLLAGTPSTAQAHGPGSPGYYGGYGAYYGYGGHDVYPHWHRTYIPFGPVMWYGSGRHDYRPHYHRYSPWGYRGYSYSRWGPTVSYYPRYPYSYAPW